MAPGGAATKQQQPELQTAKRCFQGRIVRKRFGDHGFFQGKVLEVWSDGKQTFGHVRYEDGDKEDVLLHELKRILVDHKEAGDGVGGGVGGGGGGSSTSSKKRPAAPASSASPSPSVSAAGPALKRVKIDKDRREAGGKGKGKAKGKGKGKHVVKMKVKRDRRVEDKDSGEEQDDISLSISVSDQPPPPRHRKPMPCPAGKRESAAGSVAAAAAAAAKAARSKSDAYRAGLGMLIADGRLHAGEGCVRVSRGADEVVTAALLPNGDVRHEGTLYASAEDLAMRVFAAKAPAALRLPLPQEGGEGSAQEGGTVPMDVGAGAGAGGDAAGSAEAEAEAEAETAAAAKPSAATEEQEQGEGKKEKVAGGGAEIRIEIGGEPVEYWEDFMAPIRGLEGRAASNGNGKKSEGGQNEAAAAAAAKQEGEGGSADDEDTPEPASKASGLDEETAKGWLRQTERAVGVLEAVLKDAGAMAAITGGGKGEPDEAGEEATRRLANLRHLKAALRKLQGGLRGEEGEAAAASASSAAAAVPAPSDTSLDKDFSVELLRLHWLPWLHAEVEQTLRGLPGARSAEVVSLQAEVAKSLGGGEASSSSKPAAASAAAAAGAENGQEEGEEEDADAGAETSQLQIAELADYRYQLKHMVPDAREVVLDKLHTERGALKASMLAYNRQACILEAVQGQEDEARRRRHESERDLRAALASSEAEERRLLEELEAARARLAETKLELSQLAQVNGAGVGLLQRKTQRWKDKVVNTNRIYHSVQERIHVLEGLDRYMEGLELDTPLAERLHFHLAKVSTWCCHRLSDHTESQGQGQSQERHDDRELAPRCRIRLAYELFYLVKRLWDGEIPVRVDNIAKLQEAFQSVYMQPERSPLHWEGLPLAFPDAGSTKEQQQKQQSAAPRLCRGRDGGYQLKAGEGAGAEGEGAGATDVTVAEVEKALAFQTVIVAPAADDDGRFVEAVLAAAKEAADARPAAGAEAEGNEGVEHRPLRCLLLPPQGQGRQGVPQFLYDCLVLVHSQHYLSRVASLSAAAAAAAVSKAAGGWGAAAGAAANTRPPSSASNVDNPSTQAPSPLPMEVAQDDAQTAAAATHKKPSPTKGKASGGGGGGGMVVPWWEEVVKGDPHAPPQVAPGAFAAAVQAAARVCKAIDLVILADPATEAEQGSEVETGHRGANAACLVQGAGHVAGRYGSSGQEAAAAGGHGLINLAVVGLMHARVSWGMRKIAVVDLDPRQYGQGTDEILKGDNFAFYASVHTKPPPLAGFRQPPRDIATATRVLCSLPRKSTDSTSASAASSVRAAFRRHLSKAILPALEAMFPELILLSLPADEPALRLAGLEATDVSWAAREIDAVARRLCVGRLVSMVEAPASLLLGAEEEEVKEAAAAADRKILAAHLRGLTHWTSQQQGSQEQELEVEQEQEAGGTKDNVRPGQGKGRKRA